MSYKHYGRLIGKIANGFEGLTSTSPANTTTPFNEQAPGTKFMAYGEDATSLAFNRAFGALATNIDSIGGILGSPALRSEMLRPGTSTEPGFTVLRIEDANKTRLSLGDTSGASTQPPVWVYCGFTQESLARSVKLFHVDGEDTSGLSDNRANLDSRNSFTNYNLSPADCSETTGGRSYFEKPDGTAQSFVAGSKIGMPLFIPPVRRIASDIAPYSGSSQSQLINAWDSDGLYVKDETVGDLCLRPGCFVEVQNNGDPDGNQGNNGLFRIDSIAHNSDTGASSTGSKLVLTRGNLHRVTVDDDTHFTSGELVSWQTRPNHAVDSSADPKNRTNFAHVMYTVARPDVSTTAADLYLASVSGPNNFKYSGASKIDAGSSDIAAVTSYGTLGLADQEEGADDNWSMPIGTLLFTAISQTDPANANYATITQALPAGYPVVFTTLNTPGKFYPCTPPGFLLNPELTFGDSLLPGNNYLWAKTLTTVGEQLRSNTDGYFASAAEDASSEPYQTRQDVIATEVLLGHIHQGGAVVSGSDILNQPKSPTANILGPSLWKVRVTQAIGTDDFSTALSDRGVTLGSEFALFSSADGLNNTAARPLTVAHDAAAGETTLVLSDVMDLHSHHTDFSLPPLQVGHVIVLGANHFEISHIDEAPYISDVGSLLYPGKGDGNNEPNKFIMSYGLNAAFHAHGSASEFTRGRNTGFGNTILVPGGERNLYGGFDFNKPHRPFTTILEGLAPFEIAHLTVSDHGSIGIAEVYERDGTATARIRHDSTAGDGTLTFADKNTMNNPDAPAHGGDIPFSSTETTHDPNHVLHNLRDLPTEVRQRSLLGTMESLLQGSSHAGDVRGVHSYGALSNGVFYGAEVLSKHDETTGAPQKLYEGVDLSGNWTGTDLEISVAEAYFHEFGAKNYVAPRIIDLQTHTGNDVLVYWSISGGDYATSVVGVSSETGSTANICKSTDSIPIAVVTVGALEIEQVVDIRQRICRSDQRDEIYVGRTLEDFLANTHESLNVDDAWAFRQGSMHFPTISHAVKAIEKWNRHLPEGRSWTIKVVGPTHEVSTPHRGIQLPIAIPVDSLKIEGLGARSTTQSMDSDGVNSPLITVWGYNGLFDLNSCSNLTFSKLSIKFAKLPSDDWAADRSDAVEPVVNVFTNTKSALMALDMTAIGGQSKYGRVDGGYYTSQGSQPLQENITIADVHVSGPHHCFFHHGQTNSNSVDPSTHEDVPFDNLTISGCTNVDGFMGFVILTPSNAEGHSFYLADQRPYYWRNINITNCKSVGAEPFPLHNVGDTEDLDRLLKYDGIHLAACKEVVIRDCVISNHVKGITFGQGNGAHSCTGVIENNTVLEVFSDSVTAYSAADQSAIRIIGNHIDYWGADWDGGSGPEPTRADAYERDNRFAAVRISGNGIVVENNFINQAADKVPTELRVTTQNIYISDDVPKSLYSGIKIQNNTVHSVAYGSKFLYSKMKLLSSLIVRGNSHSINKANPFFESNLHHPVFSSIKDNLLTYAEDSLDPFGLDLHYISDSIIDGNVFHGHASIAAVFDSSISNNQFKYPSTMVSVSGGRGFSFAGNNLDNGTLFFHGTRISVTGNDFCNKGDTAAYFDIYGRADFEGVDKVYPGVYIQLEDSADISHPSAVVSNNTFTSTPEGLWYDGSYNHTGSDKHLHAIISITQNTVDSWLDARATVSGNVLTDNGYIYIQAGTDTTVSGNEVDTRNVGSGVIVPSLCVLNVIPPDYVRNGRMNGLTPANINVSGNQFGGDVYVNGCYAEFRDWNELVDGLLTGNRPIDGSEPWPRNGAPWSSHADPSTQPIHRLGSGTAGAVLEYRHNKVGNVNLSGNTILGNVEFVAVRDSSIVNNSFPVGSALISLDSLAYSGYEDSKDTFRRGQIALLSCKRVQISSCRFASLFVMNSSLIQCSDSIVGWSAYNVDNFHYPHQSSLGTYGPVDQGRVFFAYSHNITIDSCQLTDAYMDRQPSTRDSGAEHPRYMNDFDAAVYSSVSYGNNNGIGTDDEISVGQLLYRNIYGLGAISTHAMTVSNSHVSRSQFNACDDLKITGNRYYYGGSSPKARTNLIINESSMRPCIQNNHFTASIIIGDIGSFKAVQGKEGSRTWDVMVESIVRMPVHAQITGNRFDSAVGAHFDEWVGFAGVSKGQQYGSGDIKVYNFGGSLIANNHMMKSPFGYMMHAGGTSDLDDFSQYQGVDLDSRTRAFNARKDLNNRIGGRILLDPSNSYSLDYYTKGHVWGSPEYTAVVNTDAIGDDSENAFHKVHIGTGLPNKGTWDKWSKDTSDAPEPWRIKTWTGTPNTPGTKLNELASQLQNGNQSQGQYQPESDTYLAHLPWGGVWVFNWFATADTIYADAYVDINPGSGQGVIRCAEHFPKTLGAFVIGNACKNIVMDDRIRQSSWAYGRHCDIRVDRHGQPHLPAQAFETPLNPMHANNHAQFNMLRTKSEHIDLAVWGNFGSYVIKSNYALDAQHGPEREAAARFSANVKGELFITGPGSGDTDFEYVRLSQPKQPDDKFLFDNSKEDVVCSPWNEVVDQEFYRDQGDADGGPGGGGGGPGGGGGGYGGPTGIDIPGRDFPNPWDDENDRDYTETDVTLTNTAISDSVDPDE